MLIYVIHHCSHSWTAVRDPVGFISSIILASADWLIVEFEISQFQVEPSYRLMMNLTYGNVVYLGLKIIRIIVFVFSILPNEIHGSQNSTEIYSLFSTSLWLAFYSLLHIAISYWEVFTTSFPSQVECEYDQLESNSLAKKKPEFSAGFH